MGKKTKLFILGALITAILLAFAVSCSSQTAARGWAGVNQVNDTLVLTTMKGRIYSVDSTNNTVYPNPIKLEVTSSGGLSCIPTCSGPTTTPIAVYSSPAVGGDIALIGGFDGVVYAYPLINGQLREQYRWKYPPDGNVGASIVGGLTISGDNVYFSSVNGTLFSVNVTEGYKNWSIELGSKVWSAPAVDGDTLYIGCFDKNLYAINTTNGAIKWQYKTSGAISSTAIVDKGLVYIGNYDRNFYAISTTTHQAVWIYPTANTSTNKPNNWFWAKPVLLNSVIYAPCLDGKVYALNVADGSLKQLIDFKTTNVKNPAIASALVTLKNTVIVAVTDLSKKTSDIWVIDPAIGTRVLTSFTEGVDANLFASNGLVYVHTAADSFYTVNPTNGATQKITLTATTTTK